MQWQNIITCYRSLIAAVIDRAIDDLKETGLRCGRKDTDRAMAFILSDTCEAYCLELEIDCGTIREKAAALYRQIIKREKKPRRAAWAGALCDVSEAAGAYFLLFFLGLSLFRFGLFRTAHCGILYNLQC